MDNKLRYHGSYGGYEVRRNGVVLGKVRRDARGWVVSGSLGRVFPRLRDAGEWLAANADE